MYRALTITNFKAIGPGGLRLELAPITVLVGPAGCGKSSALEALALTAQSATEHLPHNDLVLSGELVDLDPSTHLRIEEPVEPIAALVHGCDTRREISVEVEVDLPEAAVRSEKDPELLSALQDRPTAGYRWARRGSGQPGWTHRYSLGGVTVAELGHEIVAESDYATYLRPFVRDGAGAERLRGLANQLHPPNRVLPEEPLPGTPLDALAALLKPPDRAWLGALRRRLAAIDACCRRRFHQTFLLSAQRGLAFLRRANAPQTGFVGRHGEGLLFSLEETRLAERARQELVGAWAARFGLPDFLSGRSGEGVRASFRDPHGRARLDLEQAGGAALEGLVLVAALLLPVNGSTCLLEEPTLGLPATHLRLLPALLADAARLGQQVIAGTHDERLVLALGEAVRGGELPADSVRVLYLQSDERGDFQVRSLPLERSGSLEAWARALRKGLPPPARPRKPAAARKPAGRKPASRKRTSARGRTRRPKG